MQKDGSLMLIDESLKRGNTKSPPSPSKKDIKPVLYGYENHERQHQNNSLRLHKTSAKTLPWNYLIGSIYC
jgi:hypothetical protein